VGALPASDSNSNKPTERQIALFSAMEDIHDLTNAIVVLLVDAYGTLIAISGDENEIPVPIRKALSGKKLAAAGSARELLSRIEFDDGKWPTNVNVSIFDVLGTEHVLGILFDANVDVMTVQEVGKEASDMVEQILKAPL
jgi:hypothetical protein